MSLSVRTISTIVSDVFSYICHKYRRTRRNVAVKLIWFTADSQTEAYRRWVEYRIRSEDAKIAVGGFDSGIGELQFDFLKREGLKPEDSLLDIGCGCLRAGRFFIDYLNEGNYTGMDINERMIMEGKSLIGSMEDEKDPTFINNDDLRFRKISMNFDYIIAQSVFTHLREEGIRECFENINTVMNDDSIFYFTFIDGDMNGHFNNNPTIFAYTDDEIRSWVDDSKYTLEFVPQENFPHPRDQRMVKVKLK